MVFVFPALAWIAAAQLGEPAPRPSRVRTTDSATALRTARSAQADFERVHRANLPRTRPYSISRSQCDEVIGRFCFWNDESEDDPPPPPEHKRVIAARDALLRTLDSASRVAPGNQWIIGQRVRYLIEAGKPDDALEAARGCRSSAWWCDALRGWAHHSRAEFAAADSAFGAALTAMPEPVRCEWRDLSLLLDDRTKKTYEKQTCAQRVPTEERFWWHADPLFSTPGNERRTEHYVRRLLDALQDDTPSGYGLQWASDLSELLIRFGWPSWWAEVFPQRNPAATTREILAHHRAPSYQFSPPDELLGDSLTAALENWEHSPRQPRDLYSPGYGSFRPLENQIAAFRRGDSLLLVAAFDTRSDSLLRDLPLTGWLFASRGPAEPIVSAHADSLRGRGTLTKMVADTTHLVAVEAVANGVRAGRARATVRAVSRESISLSDLLIIDASDSLPASLEHALGSVRGSTRVDRAQPLAIFWETYGLAPGQSATVSLSAAPMETGLLRRIAQSLRMIDRDASLAVRWSEQRDPARGVGHAIGLDVRSLRPGRYEIELTVRVPGAPPAVARRNVEITK